MENLSPTYLNTLPLDILLDIGNRLSWKQAFKYCRISKRLRGICQDSLWLNRAKKEFTPGLKGEEFGNEDEYSYPYENNFFNYLAARVRYLNKKLNTFHARRELPDFYDLKFDKNDLEFSYQQYKRIDKYGKITDMTEEENDIENDNRNYQRLGEYIDKINKEIVDRGYEPIGKDAYSLYARKKVLSDYFDMQQQKHEEGKIEAISWKEEVEGIENILAKYLKSTYPSSFLVRIVPYDISIDPYIVMKPSEINDNFLYNNLRRQYMFNPDDLLVFVSSENKIKGYAFMTNSGEVPLFEITMQDKFKPGAYIPKPSLLKIFTDRMGVDDDKLYDKTELYKIQLNK